MEIENTTSADMANEIEDLKFRLAAAQREMSDLKYSYGDTEQDKTIVEDLEKCANLQQLATEIIKQNSVLTELITKLTQVANRRDPKLRECVVSSIRIHEIRMVFIINGENVPTKIDDRHQLGAARTAALIQSHNTGYPVNNWRITDEKGLELDPNKAISEFGFIRNVRLFLTIPMPGDPFWKKQGL